jgi:hypothetical protein
MAKRKIAAKIPENEEVWFKCAWCHTGTAHTVLSTVKDKTSESVWASDDEIYEDALWWIDVHQTV